MSTKFLCKFLGALVAVASLAGCIQADKHSLSADAVARFRLTDVAVAFAPNASIHYSDAQDEVANAQVGNTTGEATQQALTEKVKAHERERVSAVISTAFRSELGPKLTGNQPVKARVTVSSFWVPGVLGTVLVGGTAQLVAGVELFDAKSNALLVGFDANKGVGTAPALGGIGGAVINAAVDSNSVDGRAGRMARNFANEYATWLLQR